MSSDAGADHDPRSLLGYLLKHAQRDFEAATTTALAPLGVDGRDFGVLRVLDARVPRSQQDVAQLLGVDRTTMVALLDSLEAKGIVSRHPQAGDRRRNVVELTESGQRTLRRAAKAYDEAEQAYLAPLGAQGAPRLLQALTTLVIEHAPEQRSPADPGRRSTTIRS